MILADYLSRHRRHYDDPNDVIPISFRLTRPVHINPTTPRCLPMLTRRLAKAVGMEPPPVHGAEKGIDPHKKPEHQKCSPQLPPRPPPQPSAQSVPGQIPIPSSRPRSRAQEFLIGVKPYSDGCPPAQSLHSLRQPQLAAGRMWLYHAPQHLAPLCRLKIPKAH